ncbi:4'-phosphopantetheinyl transferase family protein [Novispirillum itersonii]|uniref:4'-phosphopantetheinyl transferase family protein n=1 Tax=Novispirillum itersonii TaxID=189 RepID=UPI000364D868|nr:4'-phosphopantetheinyl transferase superfamily protein [Novispirillum itersonii]
MTPAPPLWLAVRRQTSPLPAGPRLLPEEEERLHRMAPARRDQSRAASLLLGHLCARVFSCPPAAVAVGRTPQGAPLVQAPAALQVSLSHSGGWLAAAARRDAPVGVDIETERPVRPAVIPEILTPAEQIAAAENPARIIALWCLKEAFLKATGDGLRRDPRSVEFRLEGDHVICHGDATGWQAALLSPRPGLWLACLCPVPFTLHHILTDAA